MPPKTLLDLPKVLKWKLSRFPWAFGSNFTKNQGKLRFLALSCHISSVTCLFVMKFGRNIKHTIRLDFIKRFVLKNLHGVESGLKYIKFLSIFDVIFCTWWSILADFHPYILPNKSVFFLNEANTSYSNFFHQCIDLLISI